MNVRFRDEAEECCRWCRRPANMCRSASSDDTPTYRGVLRFGEWVEEDEDQPATARS